MDFLSIRKDQIEFLELKFRLLFWTTFYWKGWSRNAVYQRTDQGLGRVCQNIATVCIKALYIFSVKIKSILDDFQFQKWFSILYFMLDVLLILFCSIHIILDISILTVVYVTFFLSFAPELSFTWFQTCIGLFHFI